MAFFTSEYECKLDAKGRLVLPARIKNNLPESADNELFLQKGFEPYLILYPSVEFRKIYSKIAGLNSFTKEERMLQRNFFRSSSSVELDTTGRILIPKPMLQYAGLERQAIVIGVGNVIEIWSPSHYQKFMTDDQEELSKLAEKYLSD